MPELGAVPHLLLALFGALIGLLGSSMGVGGGIFLVPLLVLAAGVPIHNAVAVSLLAVAATSSAVASVNVERGLANMRLGITLETATAAGSVAGAVAAGFLSARAVQLLFALTLFPVSAAMFLKGRSGLKSTAPPPAPAGGKGRYGGEFYDPSLGASTSYAVRNLLPAGAASFGAGSLSGLLGIGGGVIQVPVMNLLCGVPIKAAAATSNFIIGVSASASAIVYFRRGLLPAELAASVTAGVLAGSFAGMYLLYRVRSEKIQVAFAALTFLTAVKMLQGVL